MANWTENCAWQTAVRLRGLRPAGLLAEQLGWELVWIGLWFPLDQLMFYPLAYTRESRVLRVLADAEIVVTPYLPVAPARGRPAW